MYTPVNSARHVCDIMQETFVFNNIASFRGHRFTCNWLYFWCIHFSGRRRGTQMWWYCTPWCIAPNTLIHLQVCIVNLSTRMKNVTYIHLLKLWWCHKTWYICQNFSSMHYCIISEQFMYSMWYHFFKWLPELWPV